MKAWCPFEPWLATFADKAWINTFNNSTETHNVGSGCELYN